jgi:hypothetical protein
LGFLGMSGIRWLWRNHRATVLFVCVLAALGLVVLFIWPFTDLIAQHDVGLIKGSQRALQLQAARATARTQLLTFGAGVLAAGALAFTAWNVTLYRKNLTIIQQGQVTDRYTKAIEQLGSDNLHVRIGGIYALQRIAVDSAEYQPIVTEVLTAFLREQRGVARCQPGRGTISTGRRSGRSHRSRAPVDDTDD